eukprot:g27290.t1
MRVLTPYLPTKATLGGVLYDAASWRGCATYHVACLALQVLSLAIQPAVHKSFREFLGGAAAKSVDGTDDAVRPFSGATAIVPAADGCQSPESERACSFALPGAVEGGSPRQSEADDADVVDPTPLRGANELEATPQRGRAGSAHTAGDSPEPNVAEQKNGGKLPRDLYLPAFVIMLSSFNNNASYGVEWSTFAIFFKEQHGWESATWAGICQTAGDLLAAVIMAVAGKPTRADLSECFGRRTKGKAGFPHSHLHRD